MEIKKLTLFTVQLTAQKHFYESVLGLEVMGADPKQTAFALPGTQLRFEEREHSQPYHFAINIPSNQINEAVQWLKKRVTIEKDGGHEIVDFPAWNAQSVYFYDTNKNIVEFIARRDLDNKSKEPFSVRALLEISEIGVATSHFNLNYDRITKEMGLEKFGGGREVFAAFGTDNGLFILIDRDKKNWFPTNDVAFPAPFEAEIATGTSIRKVTFGNDNLQIDRNASARN